MRETESSAHSPLPVKKIGDFNFIWQAEKDFEIKALFRVLRGSPVKQAKRYCRCPSRMTPITDISLQPAAANGKGSPRKGSSGKAGEGTNCTYVSQFPDNFAGVRKRESSAKQVKKAIPRNLPKWKT